MKQTVRIGDLVRDRITGVKGIAIARTVWINGCVRIVIQPQEHKDGKPVESTCLDEPQLEVVEEQAMTPEPEYSPQPERAFQPRRVTGGPRDDAKAASR